MMRNYDIKFVNKEIALFGGLSLFLKTIRYELLSTPAYLGRVKDKHMLYLARSLRTRQAFLNIWEKLKDFSMPYNTEKS